MQKILWITFKINSKGSEQLKNNLKRLVLVLIAVSIVFSTATLNAFGDDTVTTTQSANSTTQPSTESEEQFDAMADAEQMLEAQRQELAQKIQDAQTRLDALEATSKDTIDYINALDEKIGYINEELTVLDEQISTAQVKIDTLQKDIDPLTQEISLLEAQYSEAKAEYDTLHDELMVTYDAYCQRMRAMYISGETSIIATLLTSDDLSQLLSRYEMIQAITKMDAQLLDTLNNQMDVVVTKQDGLNTKKAELEIKTADLVARQDEIKAQQDSIEAKQEEIAQKKISLALDRAESDRLLAEYTAKTQLHTEFKHEDEELLAKVNQEIDNLINGLIDPSEATTAVSSDNSSSATSTTINYDQNALYSKSNAVLNMTYPVPNHYTVSLGYGYYSDGRPHPAIDYPLSVGTSVVAAQKGIVISVQRLNYSYGYYVMIYHGTDAKGRTVVTLYAHNSEILVSPGQTVAKGQQIAKGGSTGNSTGPHCHFELRLDGEQVNPANYLSKY